MLGVDCLTEIMEGGWCFYHPRISIRYFRLDIEEFAHRLTDCLVEVEQELPTLLEEGTDIILIIVEERRLTIGALQGVPVEMAPIAVIADADILY